VVVTVGETVQIVGLLQRLSRSAFSAMAALERPPSSSQAHTLITAMTAPAVEVPALPIVLPAVVDVPEETVLTIVPRLPPGNERGVRTTLAPRSFSVARVAR
jgi:hypothetical protein